MTPFFTILTNYGKTALAEALAAQQPLAIPHMAAGDGGGEYYEPTETQTNLRNEQWRGELNDLRTDEELQGQVIAEAIIPHGIDGDWTAREIGLFDAKGGLVAVGKYPETYIPSALSGAKSQVYINIIIKVDNVAAVQLIVNHDLVLASKPYVTELVNQFKTSLMEDGGALIGLLPQGTLKDAIDWVTPQMFGAVGDGVADDTDALQATIDYCAPFMWQGSVAETKKQLGKINAYLKGFGKFRITRPILLSPFLVIDCGHNGGFYGSNGGFQIIADFDAKDLFAVDSAPYNSIGERVLGYDGSRSSWDDGKFSGCMGWVLRGVSILVAKGRNLRGTLNRCMAAQSWVFNCSLTGGNIGVKTSVSWGGGVQLSQITARAIAFLDLNDTTIDYQSYNYLSIIGSKPTSDEFSWPDYPYAPLTGKTTLLFSKYAHPIFEKNVLEGGEIAAMLMSDSRINLNENYIEGGSFEYVVAAHSVSFKMALRYLHTPSAGMFHLIGATANLDAKSVSYLNVTNWGVSDDYSSIRVSGAYNGAIKRIPWHKHVQYTDIDINGERTIYLSENGSDTNTGFLSTLPLLTLQEAIERCDSTKHNIIMVSGDVGTKYTYSTGGDVTYKIVNINSITFKSSSNANINVGALSSEVHSLPMGIKNVSFEQVNVKIPIMTGGDYRPFISCLGHVNITINGGVFSGGALMGCKYKQIGHANLVANDATLSCVLQHEGHGRFSWIDTAFNVSTTGGSVGSTSSRKITSDLYPS